MSEAEPTTGRQLTKQEAKEISRAFAGASEQVSFYLSEHHDSLTKPQRKQLADLEAKLMARAGNFSAVFIQLAMAEADDSIAVLNGAIEEGEEFLKKVATINQAITVLTTVLTLATAIAAKDPKGILKQAKALKKQLGK